MGKDYYNILGLDKNASKDDIKKAYRKLAMQYHPDKNPGDKSKEDKFKDISEAYSILSNDEKKSKYDRFGSVDGNDFNMNDYMGGFNFDDIFSGFGFDFGNTWNNRKTKRGNDLKVKLNIDLINVRDGLEKTFKYKRQTKCKSCDGFGGEHQICSVCNGSGAVRQRKRTVMGMISTTVDCETCSGNGYVITNQCNHCYGTGTIEELTELSLNLPKGIENGDKFRLGGKGNAPFRPGKGGIYGDLIIDVTVKQHPIFVRNGINLLYKLDIPLPMLILGGKIKIPTLDSTVEVKLKPQSKVGEILRLRNKGLSDQRGYKGDILIELSVKTPENISDEERQLLEQLSEMPNFKNY